MFAKNVFARACVLVLTSAAVIGGTFLLWNPAIAQAQPPEPIPEVHNAALLQPFPDPPPQAALSEISLAAEANASSFASWSKIAYQSFRNGNWEIYVTDGDGGKPVNVTNHSAADANPDLLLGATRIVFNSNRDGNSEIYSMNVDGTDLRRLTYSTAEDYAPAWSPDGKSIAFVSDRSGNLDIFVMNASGGGLTRMTTSPEPDVSPVWSSNYEFFWSHLHGKYNEYGDIMRSEARLNAGTVVRSNLPFLGSVAVAPYSFQVVADYDVDKDYWNELVKIEAGYLSDRVVYDPGMAFVDIHANAISADWKWVLGTRYEYSVVKNKLVLNALRLQRAPIYGGAPVQWLAGSGYDLSPSWASADLIAPKVSMVALPKYMRYESFLLAWEGGDYGPAGIETYDVQISPPNARNGPWQNWRVETPATSDRYYPSDGFGVYRFRVRGHDAAGNVPDWPYYNVYQMETIVYGFGVAGRITDNRGNGLPGARIEGADSAFNPPVAGPNGAYALYFGAQVPKEIKASSPGFGAFPAAPLTLSIDSGHSFYLPPADNVVRNNGFEVNLDGWTGGEQVGGLSADGVHSGRAGLAVRSSCPGPCSPELTKTQTQVTVTDSLRNPTLAFFYANDRSNINPVPLVEVYVTDAATTTLVYAGSNGLGWAHGWADLTPWQGQVITVTFQALPTSDPYPVHLFLDDVTVGSWTTPLIDSVSPSVIPHQWETTEMTIHGGNFQPGTRGYLGTAEAAVRLIDHQTLALLPPAGLQPGSYDLVVVNPGAQRMLLTDAVQLGSTVNLPALSKETRP